MKIFFFIIFSCIYSCLEAQNPGRFKNKPSPNKQAANRNKTAGNKAPGFARFREEYEKIKSEFDSTDLDFAILINDNAGLFAAKHKPEQKAKFLKMAGMMATLLKDADLSDAENAQLNLDVGKTAYALGRFIFSERRLNAAKDYFEKAFLKNDIGYLQTVSAQGLLYSSLGRFHLAENNFSEALEINKTTSSNTSISLINNLATLYFNQGRYNEAEKEFEKARIAIEAIHLSSSMTYAIVLNNSAMLLQALGRYDEALQLLQKAIAIADQNEASKAKQQLKFYSNLALLYQQIGNYTDAENTYRLLQGKYEKGTTEQANLLNNLAILLLVMNKHDRIEEILKNSSNIYKTNLGENSAAFVKSISDLGNFYRYKGRFNDAKPLLQKVLTIREQIFGTTHPLFVQSQEDLAILYWKKNDLVKAKQLYHDVMEKSLDFINNYFTPMSDAERTNYWEILSPRFQRYYNFVLDAAPSDSKMPGDLFEYRTATKGLLLQSAKKVSQSILNSGNKDLVELYDRWLYHKEQLAGLYVFSKEELKEQNVNIDSLQALANAMEKNLSANSKEFEKFSFAGKPKSDEIKKNMRDDEALIEIIRLRYFDQTLTDSIRYAGMVVTKKDPFPKLVLLPTGKQMEIESAKNFQQAIKNKVSDERSWNIFWQPFEQIVKGKKKIYISSDGVYNQINLNTLKKGGEDYLINKYDIVLLSSPKDLVKNDGNIKSQNNKKATLIGYPDFGSDKIPELPATQMEVDEINKVLTSSGYMVNELVQKDASETNLKQAKNISILHIATHGYFLQNIEKIFWPIGVHTDNAKENVLLRSGLLLAGATADKNSDPGFDSLNNGIITAFEAMNLDLNGTNLVVLSACETGLGEIKAGEGVYGLQRAFLTAGAETVIMSLWKVDDRATQELMNNFYNNLIKQDDKQKAFKDAQQQLMKIYKEPYYWGAFVMIEN